MIIVTNPHTQGHVIARKYQPDAICLLSQILVRIRSTVNTRHESSHHQSAKPKSIPNRVRRYLGCVDIEIAQREILDELVLVLLLVAVTAGHVPSSQS